MAEEDASTDGPRGFMLAAVALIATILTIADVVPWTVVLALGALSIPLGLWYWVSTRRRGRPRHAQRPSPEYAGCLLLLLLALQLSTWWEVASWAGGGAKWLIVFAVCWVLVSRLRSVALRDRLREAQGHHR